MQPGDEGFSGLQRARNRLISDRMALCLQRLVGRRAGQGEGQKFCLSSGTGGWLPPVATGGDACPSFGDPK